MDTPKRWHSRTARLPVLLTPEEHRRIKVRAAQVGMPMSDAARRLLLGWVCGRVAIPEDDDGILGA